MEYTVESADRFIASHAVDGRFQPAVHITAPIGWINDPNGFCWYKGSYHLFCQYYPYKPVWGPMHWGHWTSPDLISWTWVGVALAPNQPYDRLGCFSGTALEREGRLWLVYTGVHEDGQGEVIQEQCLAVSDDGIRFEKYEGNPIVTADMLPPGSDRHDFRDPKLLDDERGLRLFAAHRGKSSGHIVVFRGSSLYDWQYEGELKDGISTMPECPDYFPLEGRDVLMTCLMDQPKDGLRFQNEHHAVVYFVGKEMDGRFAADYLRSIDLGQDFYAPQTVKAPDGRRIMIGWMQMWGEAAPNFYLKHGWQGAYTIPRELSLEGNELIQRPVRELEKRHGRVRAYEQICVNGLWVAEELRAKAYRLQLTLGDMQGREQVIRLKDDGAQAYARLCYDRTSGVLSLDRSGMYWPVLAMPGNHGANEAHDLAQVQLPAGMETLELDILVDSCSIEVFAHGGRAALTSLAYPEDTVQGFSLEGQFTAEKLRFIELS